jgi:hypothetical protein
VSIFTKETRCGKARESIVVAKTACSPQSVALAVIFVYGKPEELRLIGHRCIEDRNILVGGEARDEAKDFGRCIDWFKCEYTPLPPDEF